VLAKPRGQCRREETGPKKEIMMKQKILINHWRWLEANGYKRQAASCKQQAANLTRKNYNVIVSYKLKEKEV
jgi:hypothetical protein